MSNESQWLNWAMELQALGQSGEAYAGNIFDQERYARIRQIAVEMLAAATGLPREKVANLFCNETGYQTPKLDTRTAIVKDGKILLVQEADGRWALPGGWADVGLSIAENAKKETLEEAGLVMKPLKLVALLDRSRNNPGQSPYSIQKAFILGEALSGSFIPNTETLDSAYFSLDALPPLAEEKTTKAQLAMCLEAAASKHWQTLFD
ncbi:MAG: NUDIX hydrolase N-terminal domain-containing protein [Christensenellales bacterium]|jgi:ADP-ribose pyrophosphatase YjhB (NUDIX family)